jgi:hypothetical protein
LIPSLTTCASALLLIALKQFTQLSPDTTEFVRQVTCDPQSKACMTRECADCLGKIDQYLPQLAPNAPQETVTYHQWQTTDRAQKVAMKASIHDIFGQIKTKLQEFLVHVYVKRQQADYMTEKIKACNGTDIVLQVCEVPIMQLYHATFSSILRLISLRMHQ